MIFELILRNKIVRFFGLYTRFFIFKFIIKSEVSINKLLGGKDEGNQYKQEVYNAIVGSFVFAFLSICIAYLVFS